MNRDEFFASTPEEQSEFIFYAREHIRYAQRQTQRQPDLTWITDLLKEYEERLRLDSFASRMLFRLLFCRSRGICGRFAEALREINTALHGVPEDAVDGMDWNAYLESGGEEDTT